MTDAFRDLPDGLIVQVNRLCNNYEKACRAAPESTPRVEDFLNSGNATDIPAEFHNAIIRELLPIEIEYRRRSGQAFDEDEYRQRFADADQTWLTDQLACLTAPRNASDQSTASRMPERIGDYDIIERIGSGGMGEVYRAVHRRMDRTVALKVLRSDIARDPQLIQRFEREVKAAARLTHKNIVAALDAREEDGVYCLITEFIDGSDLNEIVRNNGPMSPRDAVNAVVQAARGLKSAHEAGVIHRDIKPANLLRDTSGVVKILDMGLARMESGSIDSTELTTSGMVMGTAAYMAPEQARNTKTADERSDIYSLGCTLFYLLTGRHPYSGETAIDTILAHTSNPIPSLTDATRRNIPKWLDDVFTKMVAKEPGDRFQEVSQFIEAVRTFVSSPESITTPDAAVETPSIQKVRRNNSKATDETVQLDKSPASERLTRPNPTAMKAGIAGGCVLILVVALLDSVLDYGAETPEPTGPKNSLGEVTVESTDITNPGFSSRQDGQNNSPDTQQKFTLQFDGRISYVVAPELERQLLPDDPLTFEAFVKVGQPRLSAIVSWLGLHHTVLYQPPRGEGRSWGFGRLVGGRSILMEMEGLAMPGKRYHLAGIWTGDEIQLFVNGQREKSSATADRRIPILPDNFPQSGHVMSGFGHSLGNGEAAAQIELRRSCPRQCAYSALHRSPSDRSPPSPGPAAEPHVRRRCARRRRGGRR